MALDRISILQATRTDLKMINSIVTDCVMGWSLPERVKRLSVNSYHYSEHELEYLQIFNAVNTEEKIIGVLALEEASPSDLPEEQTGLLLHGLYVSPDSQRQGAGYALIQFALNIVRAKSLDGLLVKAQVDANSYFEKSGFERLQILNSDKDYPHRWWKVVE